MREHFAATTQNQARLRELCAKYHPKRVLEFGAGRGTLTRVVLDVVPHADITTYEPLEACWPFLEGTHVVASYDTDPPHRQYDLWIIDGPVCIGQEEYAADVTTRIGQYIQCPVVFLEGKREAQRRVLTTLYGKGTSLEGRTLIRGREAVFQHGAFIVEP